jgi:general secretion pathway protein D
MSLFPIFQAGRGRGRARLLWVLTLVLLAGCAGQRAYDDGRMLIEQGQIDEGLRKLDEAVRLAPRNQEFRQGAARQRDGILQRLLVLAEDARGRGRSEDARALYERMLAIDAKSDRARSGLEGLTRDARARAAIEQGEKLLKAGDLDGAYARAKEALTLSGSLHDSRAFLRKVEAASVGSASPQLRAAFQRTMSMQFRDAPIRMAFDLIAANTGLNFIFDRDVKSDMRITLALKDTSAEELVRMLTVTNQLERKVLNDRTILIYPNTPAKRQEHQETLIRTFYLGNSDPKVALNLLRTMVRTRDLFIDERTGILVMQDTPEAVRIAEKLLANQDLAETEVVLEVEVLEVATSSIYELGLKFPDQLSFSLVGAGGAGTLTLPEWLNRSSDLVRLSFSNPLLTFNFRNQFSRANLLANPQIRVRNREKAKIHIGDKVPIVTTTATATGFISEAVSFIDVGLKLDVEPTIQSDDDVAIRVGLEVSNIVEQIRTSGGSLTYRLGTRNASTVLRLKDGETQALAGLISNEERSTSNRIPGAGAIPGVGRLFGNTLDTNTRTEIILLITPRVVRSLARPDPSQLEFSSQLDNSAPRAANVTGAPGAPAFPVSGPMPSRPPARATPPQGAPGGPPFGGFQVVPPLKP